VLIGHTQTQTCTHSPVHSPQDSDSDTDRCRFLFCWGCRGLQWQDSKDPAAGPVIKRKTEPSQSQLQWLQWGHTEREQWRQKVYYVEIIKSRRHKLCRFASPPWKYIFFKGFISKNVKWCPLNGRLISGIRIY